MNSDVNINYLLQLFEHETMEEAIPRNEFDLRKMVNIWGDEILKELEIAYAF